ncbi:MAG: ureidoglycolate lyase [Acidimicrobiales bacterium]
MLGHGVTQEEYLSPDVAPGLPWRTLPIVDARDPELADLLIVVDGDPSAFEVPIVAWPFDGARPLDPGTGIGGGCTEGAFTCTWSGARLLARNEAVDGTYVLGFACAPEVADAPGDGTPPDQVLLWHMNHHPDGGQMFASLDRRPFLVPAVPPGGSPDLDRAVVASSDGTFAICLRPGVWHDGVYPCHGDGRFWTRQGRVHARVSADISRENGCLLRIPLGPR